MQVLGVIILIIALAVSASLVSGAQRLFMKLIGADAMFFSGKVKLFAVLFIAALIAAPVMNLLGII